MAIVYRAGSTAGNATGTDLTVNKPTGTADGDILVVVLYREAGTWTPPAGWTQIGSDQQSDTAGQMTLSAYWKRASGEGASYVFALSASTWRVAAMAAFSGCVTSGSPLSGTPAGYTFNGVTVTAATITTADANAVCVVAMGNRGGADIGAGTSGYTQGAQLGGCELWYVTQAAAGASGSKAFGTDAGSEWATIHCALAPDTGGAAAIVPAMLGRRLQFAIDVWR